MLSLSLDDFDFLLLYVFNGFVLVQDIFEVIFERKRAAFPLVLSSLPSSLAKLPVQTASSTIAEALQIVAQTCRAELWVRDNGAVGQITNMVILQQGDH